MEGKWSITPALANPHYMFYFRLSHSLYLVSWGFQDHQIATITVVHFTRDRKISLITDAYPTQVVTATVYPQQNADNKVIAI
jgi:uncharacterized protein with von Willebrand factor type A (vWA) domain